MKKPFLYISLALFASILISCKERGFKNMNEGEIFYSVKYLDSPSSMPEEMLPKEMVVSFENNKIRTELKAPFGVSAISTVYNPREEINATYINLLSLKYYVDIVGNQTQPGMFAMKDIKIADTGQEKEICGFKCRQAEVILPAADSSRYIWYTREMNVDNPNQNTPYRAVDGVLMEFFYIIGGADMVFTAEEVFSREIPESTFMRKENYTRVSIGFLDSLVVKIISF